TATQLGERARELYERHGDLRGVISALLRLSYALGSMAAIESARGCIEEAHARAGELGDGFTRGEVLVAESLVETWAGDYGRAQASLDEAIHLFRKMGVPRRLWLAQLINLGWIALHRHDFARAREALEEYLAAESWKSPIGIANAQSNLGFVAIYQGDA